MKGIWYSICWSPRNFNEPNSFIELDGCPRFYFSEDGTPDFRCDVQANYPHLYIKEVFKTEIFMQNEDGQPMPTHYRHGIFMPSQNLAYDNWLQKSFKINTHVLEKVKARQELLKKNVFLEYASKIIRHDMHSGINTYIPRGLKILTSRLTEDVIKKNKLGMGLKLLENGLKHTQQVYQGVHAFTNLVRENSVLDKEQFSLYEALDSFLVLTAYYKQVEIDTGLPIIRANQSLICTAIDNLVRNGLKYNNNSPSKKRVRIYPLNDSEIGILDNGVGMTQDEFAKLSQPYVRKAEQKETGTGLGLHITLAILDEHNYNLRVERQDNGTLMRIQIND